MREVTLPAPLDRSLDSILEVLAGNPPAREMRLGGGTALATIWAHRFSVATCGVSGPLKNEQVERRRRE